MILKRSCPIFIVDGSVSFDNAHVVSSHDLTDMLNQGTFFSSFPKCFSYDIWTDNIMSDGLVRLVHFLHGEGLIIRFWNDLSLSEEFIFHLRSYISYWGFYWPTFNPHDYQAIIGGHSFQHAQSLLDRLMSETINVFLHLPIYPYHLDDLPEWVDYILEYQHLTFFHYQHTELSSLQKQSLHYFEQFLPVFILPLRHSYYMSDLPLPLHIHSNFESLFSRASFRKSIRRLRLFLGL